MQMKNAKQYPQPQFVSKFSIFEADVEHFGLGQYLYNKLMRDKRKLLEELNYLGCSIKLLFAFI